MGIGMVKAISENHLAKNGRRPIDKFGQIDSRMKMILGFCPGIPRKRSMVRTRPRHCSG